MAKKPAPTKAQLKARKKATEETLSFWAKQGNAKAAEALEAKDGKDGDGKK